VSDDLVANRISSETYCNTCKEFPWQNLKEDGSMNPPVESFPANATGSTRCRQRMDDHDWVSGAQDTPQSFCATIQSEGGERTRAIDPNMPTSKPAQIMKAGPICARRTLPRYRPRAHAPTHRYFNLCIWLRCIVV